MSSRSVVLQRFVALARSDHLPPGADIDDLTTPSEPRPAATTVLVRDGHDGIETWMMRRAAAMAFAGGALVFPGGRVDASDADPAVPWTGTDPQLLADRMGLDPPTARALVNAALRELFEEAGVLLSDPELDVELAGERVAVEQRTMSMAQLLSAHSCSLDVSRIHPWGRWVTPPTERRRFDTWFFVAELSSASRLLSASSEADYASWMPVRRVLDLAATRESVVLPPTVVMLRGLLASGTVARAVAESVRRPMDPVHPEVRDNGDGTVSVFGGGQEVVVRI